MSSININDQVNFAAPYEETNDEDIDNLMINNKDKPRIQKLNSHLDDARGSMGISQTKTPSTAEYQSNKNNTSFDINNVSYDIDVPEAERFEDENRKA